MNSSMTTEELITALRARAADRETRTDYKSPRRERLPDVATLEEIKQVEEVLGTTLPPYIDVCLAKLRMEDSVQEMA